jgi:hypothetical protein
MVLNTLLYKISTLYGIRINNDNWSFGGGVLLLDPKSGSALHSVLRIWIQEPFECGSGPDPKHCPFWIKKLVYFGLECHLPYFFTYALIFVFFCCWHCTSITCFIKIKTLIKVCHVYFVTRWFILSHKIIIQLFGRRVKLFFLWSERASGFRIRILNADLVPNALTRISGYETMFWKHF